MAHVCSLERRMLHRHRAKKLVHTQRLLEALMTSDFVRLDGESGALLRIPQDSGWQVLNTPEYARYSAAFVGAIQQIVNDAKERDLDTAATTTAR